MFLNGVYFMSVYMTAIGAAFILNLGYWIVTGEKLMLCVSGCS